MIFAVPLLTAFAVAGAAPSNVAGNKKSPSVTYYQQTLSELIKDFKKICLDSFPSRDKAIDLLKDWHPITNKRITSLQKNGVADFFEKGRIGIVLSRKSADQPNLFSCHATAVGESKKSDAEMSTSVVDEVALGAPTTISGNLIDWQQRDANRVIYWEIIRNNSDAFIMLRIQQFSGKAN